MKKRILNLAVAGLGIVLLTGCGEKTPTIEDIQANLSTEKCYTYTGDFDIDLNGTAELAYYDDDTKELFELVSDQAGIDILQKFKVDINMNGEAVGERNDDYGYSTSDFEATISTGIPELDDTLEDEFTSKENYIDFDEEIKYYTEDGGDTWYYTEDYESNIDEIDTTTIEDILDICLAHNNNSDDEIVVEAVDGEYVVTYEFSLNPEFIQGLSKDEKKALQNLLDDLELDIELEDITDLIDEYGEYVDLDFKTNISLGFTNIGDKKNAEYALTMINVKFNGESNLDWDTDKMADILSELDAPDLGVEFGAKAGLEIEFTFNMTLGYEPQEDVEIPNKVTKNAELESNYDFADSFDYLLDDTDIDDTTSGSTTTQNHSTNEFDLYAYAYPDNLYLFSIHLPAGYELEEDFTDYDDGSYCYFTTSTDYYGDEFYLSYYCDSNITSYLEDGTLPDDDYYENYTIDVIDEFIYNGYPVSLISETYESNGWVYNHGYAIFEYVDTYGDTAYASLRFSDNAVDNWDMDDIDEFLSELLQ